MEHTPPHNPCVVLRVEPDSIGEELSIATGDLLLAINGKPVKDIFDYRYLTADEYIEVLIEKPDGQQWLLEVEKDEHEDLGLVFESGLMDRAKSCRNKCLFCFIDQLPTGMRPTLYFKDDDSRLSFLQGNYVTLTNMTDSDIDRMIYYHLSPINVSVHTTDPALRVRMLKNPKAGQVLHYIERFIQAGIHMNFQVVLCKGINDGDVLDRTIGDLSHYLPRGGSLSIVPVGITRYRETNGLFPMEPFTADDAKQVVRLVENWQHRLKAAYGTSFVYASDEFYLTAGQALPGYEAYEDFPQIENGVGMLTMLQEEFADAFEALSISHLDRTVSIATGRAAAPFIRDLAEKLMKKVAGLAIHVYDISNEFFGPHITVSGLLTGQDIEKQLTDKPLGQALLIPRNALRAGESVFLDDMTVSALSQALGVPVVPVENDGGLLIEKICVEEIT